MFFGPGPQLPAWQPDWDLDTAYVQVEIFEEDLEEFYGDLDEVSELDEEMMDAYDRELSRILDKYDRMVSEGDYSDEELHQIWEQMRVEVSEIT